MILGPDDLVAQLRRRPPGVEPYGGAELRHKAADEIDRLRRQVDLLESCATVFTEVMGDLMDDFRPVTQAEADRFDLYCDRLLQRLLQRRAEKRNDLRAGEPGRGGGQRLRVGVLGR